MLRWLRNVAFLVTGVIFGPLLLAIVTALCTPSPAGSPAQALFREYDSRHPSIVLNSASPFPAVRECGYDPDALFSREDQAHFAGPGALALDAACRLFDARRAADDQPGSGA